MEYHHHCQLEYLDYKPVQISARSGMGFLFGAAPAYIRFASVYRSFQDVDDFHDAIKEVQRPRRKKK